MDSIEQTSINNENPLTNHNKKSTANTALSPGQASLLKTSCCRQSGQSQANRFGSNAGTGFESDCSGGDSLKWNFHLEPTVSISGNTVGQRYQGPARWLMMPWGAGSDSVF
jgi:hypothetical protein